MYFVILDSVLIHTVLTICANERYVFFVHIAPGFLLLAWGEQFLLNLHQQRLWPSGNMQVHYQ